ncbi:MAG: phenylalanine--tRNA ligase subunit alpha [Candidatus Diapherotrites archaeon]|nr:phenylalanine--tRNA ligase subunit alpha [Candidatus Diapherotrites archaeon]
MKNIEDIAKALSKIEVSTLEALKEGDLSDEYQIAERASLNIDSVRRAIAWLSEKGLVELEKMEEKQPALTEKGIKALSEGLPEEKLIEALKKLGGKANFGSLLKESGLSKIEFDAAFGKAKRNSIVVLDEEKNIVLTGIESSFFASDKTKLLLNDIKSGFKVDENSFEFADALKRGLLERKNKAILCAKINERGLKALEISKKVDVREYNLNVAVQRIFLGKKQPYARFLDEVRSKLVAMGFKEMESPLIVEEFYNFDVLFQPQNHPARDWASTFRLKSPRYGKLPAPEIVEAIKEAHENGASTGSIGWGYRWNAELAMRLMPAAHGTAHSARQMVKGVEIPQKYFAIARCYRPDKIDKTHLMEFNQLEGIIVANLSFRHLLGILKEFAEEIAGASEVRFKPDYYPFTEPSVELSARHPILGWIEFGGAGLFRPEVVRPLGIKCNVLAWGLGIDRLAMFKLGIDDMRDLFSTDLDWLRNHEIVRL